MGVDYAALFGLGYEINLPKDIEEDPYGYLDKILEGSHYEHISWGDEGYSGEENQHAVILNESIISEFDITPELTKLKLFLYEKKIDMVNPNKYLVGGLSIY